MAKGGPGDKPSCMQTVFINQILLAHDHVCSPGECLWLISRHEGRFEEFQKELCGLQILEWPPLAGPGSQETAGSMGANESAKRGPRQTSGSKPYSVCDLKIQQLD